MKGIEIKPTASVKFLPSVERDSSISALLRMKSPGVLTSKDQPSHSHRAHTPVLTSINHVGSMKTKAAPQLSSPVFKRKIVGDIFGSSMGGENSMLGMLYRSRIEANLNSSDASQAHDDKSEEASLNVFSNNDSIADDSSDSDNDFSAEMNPRQRLALTIQNWSKIEENDSYLLKEGAIHAIVALAATEDNRIKMCCASTLYNLSSRPENRAELLAAGGATGAITIAKTVQQWKMAKLCALTLRNLSLFEGGEDTMAKEGAMFAIKCLLGVRSQRLAPLCIQTLYNMTCVKTHFKEMERIIKALLTLPPLTNFDATPFVVKSLVNCSRFAQLRVRIVEDGALQTFTAFLQSFHNRDSNRVELIFHMATCIRQLSDSQICRIDMISKGCVELVYQLLPYSEDDQSKLLLIKSIHNLLSVVQTFPMIIFEISVNIIIDMVLNSKNDVILQYASSCLYTFTTQEMMKGIHRLTNRLIKALPKLLQAKDTSTQYFSVATSSNMFFEDLCDEKSNLEGLLRKFVEAGDHIDDVTAIRALVVTIARLCESTKYMNMIVDGGLLDKVLGIVLATVNSKDASVLVREACCVSICRIALRKQELSADTCRDVADVLKSMLHIDTKLSALENTVSGIRALLEQNICHTQLLSDELIDKIAQIAIKYKKETELCRLCCSVLAVLSFDQSSNAGLSSDKVLNVLFAITRCDDAITREFVANCICNISIKKESSAKLIRSGVIEVISSLSGATSERIQELCAKCICNLTCVVDLQPTMIKNKLLQTILMISLVRSVSDLTRRLCARAMLNMLSDVNVKAMIDAGVIRAISNLSSINEIQTHHICARAFLIFTLNEKGREEICSRRPVLHSLLRLVEGDYMKTKIIVGKAVCNLLSCSTNRRAAITGGALSVLKIIATFNVEDIRERIAKVLIVMAREPLLYDYLIREQIVPVLVLIIKESSTLAFECAIFALTCLSEIDKFRDLVVTRGCVTSIVNATLHGKVSSVRIADEICRCFCHISFARQEAEAVVTTGNMLLGLHAIHRLGLCSKQSAEMMAVIIRNLTGNEPVCPMVVEQDGVKLLQSLMDEYSEGSPALCKAVVFVMANLGRDYSLHKKIIRHGMLAILHKVAEHVNQDRIQGLDDADDDESVHSFSHESPLEAFSKARADSDLSLHNHKPFLSHDTILNVISAIEHISNSVDCRTAIVEDGAVSIFTHLFIYVDEGGRYQMACSLSNLASTKECRAVLVEQKAEALLIALSKTQHLPTRTQCSTALGYLSEFTKVHENTVSSLLYLAYKAEEHGQGHMILHEKDQRDGSDLSRPESTYVPQANTHSGKESDLNNGPNPSLGGARLRGSLVRRMEEHEVNFVNTAAGASKLQSRSHKHLKSKQVEIYHESAADENYVLHDGGDLFETESIGSVETIQGIVSAPHISYPEFQYEVATHITNQELGGMAKKLKVDLPNPSLSKENILMCLKERFSQVVTDMPIVMTTIAKDDVVFDLDLVRQTTTETSAGQESQGKDAVGALVDQPRNGADMKRMKSSADIRKRRSSSNVHGMNSKKASALRLRRQNSISDL